LVLLMEVKDREDVAPRLWNHLLLSKNTPETPCGGEDGKGLLVVSGEVHLSWSQVKAPLPFKEGEMFRARVNAECYAGNGVDESVTDRWSSYRVWTCNVTSLRVVP
jgi:hypothetical protein